MTAAGNGISVLVLGKVVQGVGNGAITTSKNVEFGSKGHLILLTLNDS